MLFMKTKTSRGVLSRLTLTYLRGVRNTRVCRTNKLYHQVQKITAPLLHGRLRCNLDEMKEQYQKSYFHDCFKLNGKIALVVGDDLGGSHIWLGILLTLA